MHLAAVLIVLSCQAGTTLLAGSVLIVDARLAPGSPVSQPPGADSLNGSGQRLRSNTVTVGSAAVREAAPAPVLARAAIDGWSNPGRIARPGTAGENSADVLIPVLDEPGGARPGMMTDVGAPRLRQQPALGLERFLDAVEQIESGKDPRAVGDRGRARGSFQFWSVAWQEVNRLRAERGFPTVPYRLAADPATAREFARMYFGWLEQTLTKSLHRPPTRLELYAAFNLGHRGFQHRGFYLASCPPSTQRAADAIDTLLREDQGKGSNDPGTQSEGFAARR